jgi:alkanesulfonate monooxygenase SsuD/methylene tetrahydromethanopterin reductase-like flavin-dependent oxidoreductase (luciferase family)
MKGIRGKPKPYGGSRPVIMNAGASPVGQAFAIRNCDAFFLPASRTRSTRPRNGSRAPKSQAKQQAGSSESIRGRRHLQADQERGRGLLPLFDRGTCRLEGGRRTSSRSRTSLRRTAAGEVSTDPDRLRAGHGRLADRGRPGPRDEPTHRSQQGGADRGRRVARQLSRRASVLLARRFSRACNGRACARNSDQRKGISRA